MTVGVVVVGKPGLGLLNVERPRVCKDGAFSSLRRVVRDCYRGGKVRTISLRDGSRNRVVSFVRRTLGGCSKVIVGPKTCARCDCTVTSTVSSINIPAIRMRVDSVSGHRRFHEVSIAGTSYMDRVGNRNFSKCVRTVSFLASCYRGGWGVFGGALRL